HLMQDISAPKIDVERVALFRVAGSPASLDHFLKSRQALTAQLAEPRAFLDIKIDIAPSLVSEAPLIKVLDDLNHLVDVLESAGIVGGAPNVKRLAIIVEDLFFFLHELPGVEPRSSRGDLDDVFLELVQVPHIGDIHHLVHLVPRVLEVAPEQIPEQEG